MEIVRYNVARKEVYSLEVISVEEAEDKYSEVVRDSLDLVGDGKLISICTKAKEIKAEDFDQKRRELVRQAVELAEAEDYLNSTLLFLEYTLSTGESMPREFFKFKEAATADPNLKLLFASMNPKDEESAKQALPDFEVLGKKVDAGRHVFWIFQANLLTSFDRAEEAKELFLKALEENPMIVGAWKDLGQIYHRQFDCGAAWLCWDTGRSVHSGHGLFDQIDDLEDKLRNDFPEFFLP
jgi:tetratricopeptide (TPR) repeat protein